MSYVGKILVVVQVVLSLLFMAFAGAVFSMNQNWKDQYEAEKAAHALTQTSAQDARGELDIAKRDFETQLTAAEDRAGMLSAQLQNAETTIVQLRDESANREALRAEQTGLAQAKADEARFRQQEAAKQRIENEKLRVALDNTIAENRDLKDKVFTLETTYDELTRRFKSNQENLAFLQRVVAANGLETDRETVEKLKLPPPPVEGLVLRAVQDRANRVEYVSLSIGSDDGLIVGHELDVVRLAKDEGESSWLGKIKIVSVTPDKSVAHVVLPAKNGIIQEGDNVVSRLGT